MSWKSIKRLRIPRDEPIVLVTRDKFVYNMRLAEKAKLKKNEFVIYDVDEEEKKIGFQFLPIEKESLTSRIDNQSGRQFRSSALRVTSQHPWVKEVSSLEDPEDRKFLAIREGRRWIIQLTPSFEFRYKRDDFSKIPGDAKGIYRYRDENGDIVYIGKGNMRRRLSEAGRVGWEFRIIEYSVIEAEAKQFNWENFWIEKFKQENNGRLPYYNKVSGVGR